MTIHEFVESQKRLRTAFDRTDILRAFGQESTVMKALAKGDWLSYKMQQFESGAHISHLDKMFRTLDQYASLDSKIAALAFSLKPLDLALQYRNFNLLPDEIQLKGEQSDEPAERSSRVVIKESKRVKQIITDIYNDSANLYRIQPREFEEAVAELLSSQGFKVELTKQTRDNGYDLIALKYIDSHIPLKFLVECKRYVKGKVGVEIIRAFKEVIASENANRGIIVTTSYFTKEAEKKRKQIPYLLDYRDKDAVLDWVNDYQRK